MNKPSELLATRDVCRMADRSEATVRLWVRNGKLRAIRLPSGQNLFERGDVERLLAELRNAAARRAETTPPTAAV